jgi:hypothetical protein
LNVNVLQSPCEGSVPAHPDEKPASIAGPSGHRFPASMYPTPYQTPSISFGPLLGLSMINDQNVRIILEDFFHSEQLPTCNRLRFFVTQHLE